MNETIKLTLFKPLILESVKNETFQKGKFDKAVDSKAVTAAYVEQAGNETYHERILERSLYTSLEELKTHLSDYLSSNGGTTANNDIETTEQGNNIILSLVVSDRFNKGYTDTLARLSSKYIEESMLMDWWRPVNEKQSVMYANFVERDLAAIKRCFNKTAPSAPRYCLLLSNFQLAKSIPLLTLYHQALSTILKFALEMDSFALQVALQKALLLSETISATQSLCCIQSITQASAVSLTST